ncbi:MAG: DNA-directed RNA polymerase subunit alpha C-terminal domain-containing protein [Candidatus Brocadiia bacterium]
MSTTSPSNALEDLLAGPVDRDNYDLLVRNIYDSYTSVDRTHKLLRQLEADLEKASGDEARDLTEKVGILHFAMGEYDAAVERLEQVRTRKIAAHFLGHAYTRLKRYEEAVEMLERGREDEQDIGTDIPIIETLCRLHREEEAAEALSRYEDVEESADVEYARGRVAEALGEYAEALEHYEEAVQQDPEHARALFRLALNCDLNGDDERAMELYRRCVNLRPTFVGALINLGILCEDHEEYEEAIDCYKRVLAIDPHHQQARLYLRDAESSLNMYIDMTKTRRLRRLEEVFDLPVSNFELSARSRSALDRMDIQTLGGLTKITPEQLLSERNFGDTSLGEIEQLLGKYDLELGEQSAALTGQGGGTEAIEEGTLEMSVEELELSTRSRRCMQRLGIKTVGQLVQMTADQLLECPNFGDTSLEEIKTELAKLGVSLSTE